MLNLQIDLVKTGQNIKTRCKKNNVTPTMVAYELGFTTNQAIYKWFLGKSLPTVDNMVRLSQLLDCSVDDLIVTNKEIK